jgi:hypothetical protein
MPDKKESKAQLFGRLLAEAGVAQGALDNEVHDAKSAEAAAINNDGREAQLEYLIECLGGNAVDAMVSRLIKRAAKK